MSITNSTVIVISCCIIRTEKGIWESIDKYTERGQGTAGGGREERGKL